MKATFDRALAAVLVHEGGYVNHPKDPGGATNLGVTIGTAKRLGIDVDGDGDTDVIDIKLLKSADAAKVYRAEYWDKIRGDDLPAGVDYATFDFAVNSGPARAAKFLQRILNVAQDGVIGAQTLAAAREANAISLVRSLCNDRLAWLKTLDGWATFGSGWKSRVEDVRDDAIQLVAAPTVPDTAPSIPVPPPDAPLPPPLEDHEEPLAPPPDRPPVARIIWLVIIALLIIGGAFAFAKTNGWIP